MTRHPLDPVSAALGVATIVIGVLVMTDTIDVVDGDGGWWFALAALVFGLALMPWSRDRPETADPPDEASAGEGATPAAGR